MDKYWKHSLQVGAVLFSMFCLIIIRPVSGFSSETDADIWKTLKSGSSFVLLRHALAPGIGDPDRFILGDCSTQRNLSDTGRKQALAIGDKLRDNGILKARVLSSQWCRCLETAELLKLGPVEELPELNSFFRQYERRDFQTQSLKKWISTQKSNLPLVLVTHQVNITALSGYYPAEGELVIAHRSITGEIVVLGSIKNE